jgi:hypothetical protein
MGKENTDNYNERTGETSTIDKCLEILTFGMSAVE